ncbi:MAG: ABC transporter permease [Chitinophagaceae bacterium]
MLKNYPKIAWRNLVHNKAFSIINISGLGLSMACSLLIILWVQDEKGVDSFHANGKQLYQVYERNFYDGKIEAAYTTQGLMADELKKVVPEIQYASSLEWNATNTFEANGKISKMDGSFAGADFFSMFSYPLLQGKATTALNEVNSLAISKKMAEHFFGTPAKAIGRSILFENSESYQITAVFDVPVSSSQQFDFLKSWKAFEKENDNWIHNWGNTDAPTFIQLRKDADPAKVEAKIKDFIYLYKEKPKNYVTELALQPYTQKYLYTNFKNGKPAGGRIEYVRLFTLVAIFILLIACINFMNLATARSAKRGKEVGVRKVIGAGRFSLMTQFMGEAMLLTFFAIVVAVMLSLLLLPAFNILTGKQLSLPFSNPMLWISLLGLMLLTGIVAGSYPALYLSSLNPVRVLKGSLKFTRGAVFFRKGLVVFQFALSIILIIGMIVIFRQVDYIQTKNIGYDRGNLIYIPLEGELSEKYALFKQEAGTMPGVLSTSKIRAAPTLIGNHTGDIKWVGEDPNAVTSFVNTTVGYDFIKTMNLSLVAGRDFSKDFGTDSASYMLNETAVQKMGYKDPIGKQIWWGKHEGKIIGVVKDFHVASLHKAIEPLIIRLDEGRQSGTILVRTQAGKTKVAIAGLEKVCQGLNPKFPFSYKFSDEEYNRLYRSEQIVSKLANYFAFLAIFISCLGLFGLATFTAEQRIKEIGVRKVLGASVPGIISMLSKDFLKLVFIAIIIASPVAWYLMTQWLQDFAYRVDISWWIFILSGIAAVLIALLTVSFQAIRAAIANPMKSLRTE